MDYFAGLDVSVKETSVCIVDDTGKIVREVKVASEPKASLGGRVPASISCAPIASASFQDPLNDLNKEAVLADIKIGSMPTL
jgi:hypothetical protein